MIYFIYLLMVASIIELFSQLSIVGSVMSDLGGSSLMTIILFVVYFFASMLGSILSGYFIDQKGVKLVSAIGWFATSGILIVYLFISSPNQMVAVRFFHGLASGFLIPTSFVYLSKMKTSINRRKLIHYSALGVCLASIVGSIYGVVLRNSYGNVAVFSSMSALMFISGVLVIFILPQPKIELENLMLNQYLKTVKVLVDQSIMGYSYAGSLLLTFSQGALMYLLPLKIEALGHENHLSGFLLGTFVLVSCIVFALPTEKLSERFSGVKIMTVGMLILSFCLVMLSFITLVPALFMVMALYGIGFASVFSTILVSVVRGSKENQRGITYGLLFSFLAFGVVAGTFVTGTFPTVFLSFLIGGITLMLSSIYFWYSIKMNQGASN